MENLDKYFEILEIEPESSMEKVDEAYDNHLKNLCAINYQNNEVLRKRVETKLEEIEHAYEIIKASYSGSTNLKYKIESYEDFLKAKSRASLEPKKEDIPQRNSIFIDNPKEKEEEKISDEINISYIIKHSAIASGIVSFLFLLVISLGLKDLCMGCFAIIAGLILFFSSGFLSLYFITSDYVISNSRTCIIIGAISGAVTSILESLISFPFILFTDHYRMLFGINPFEFTKANIETYINSTDYLSIAIKLLFFILVLTILNVLCNIMSCWVSNELIFNRKKSERPVMKTVSISKDIIYEDIDKKLILKYSIISGIITGVTSLIFKLLSIIPGVGCFSCIINTFIMFLPGILTVYFLTKKTGVVSSSHSIIIGVYSGIAACITMYLIELPLLVIVFLILAFVMPNFVCINNLMAGIFIFIIFMLIAIIISIIYLVACNCISSVCAIGYFKPKEQLNQS